MKKILLLLVLCVGIINSEDVLVKAKKPKSESVSKLKEQMASDLEEILHLSTHAIKQLTNVIDEAVKQVKQLAGQESGKLVSADKKILEQCQQDICRLKKVLRDLDGQCCLGM